MECTRALVLGLVGLVATAAAAPEPPEPPAERFALLGPHLFPFEHGITGLIPHDMDGDGCTDLVLLDPRASKFHMLVQKDEDEEPAGDPWAEPSPNRIEPDRLLAVEELPVNQAVFGYVVGAFAGAEAALAYITSDLELIVERPADEGKWETAQRFLLDLDAAFAGGFETADMDGNGRTDLVLLAQDALLIFFQDEGGSFAEPERHPIAREKSAGLVLADVNDDGRSDVIYRSPGTRYPLRVRLTEEDGSPGPEFRFRMPAPRHVAVGECDGEPGNELVVIESTTNRLKVLRWKEGEAGEEGALELVPLPRDEKAKTRSFVVADLDGNGLPDVAVSEPAAARVSLIRSRPAGGLMPLESFPSLQETLDMAAVSAPDGVVELVTCSRKEGMVGVSRFDRESGRLTYPRPVDLAGTPQALAAVQATEGAAARLYVSLRGPAAEGERTGPVQIVTLVRGEGGYAVERRQELADLKEPPVRLLAVDPDGDGRTDLLAFRDYEPPLLLMAGAEGFQIVSERPEFRKHMLRDLKAPAVVCAGAPGAPPLLLGVGNLVRAVHYEDGNLVVDDQFSSENSRTSYVALASADLDGDGQAQILAADYATKWLAVLGRDEKGVYRVERTVEIGPFELIGLTTADLDGDGRVEVLAVGQGKLGVLMLGEGGPELEEVAVYETDQEDVAYAQAVLADLNADGKNDLLLREVQQHQIEVLYRDPEGDWAPGLRFRVFEGRLFEHREAPAPEPREIVAADVTGDGLTDVAIIVHDRVIVYPQQAPSAP